MRSALLRSSFVALLLFVPVLLALPAHAQTQTKKPLLSEVIRTTIEKQGAEAARRRYDEIARDRRSEYEFDITALVDLGSAYIQRGEMETGQLIIAIASEAALVVSGMPPEQVSASRQPAPARARRVTDEEANRRRALEKLGPGRNDLARFQGVYGDPEAQTAMTRNFFVNQTCEDHLRFGAMWGDVAPWVMKSVSDTKFIQGRTHPGQESPIRMQFHLGRDGRAEALTHNNMGMGGQQIRIARLGDLPKEYVSECRLPTP